MSCLDRGNGARADRSSRDRERPRRIPAATACRRENGFPAATNGRLHPQHVGRQIGDGLAGGLFLLVPQPAADVGQARPRFAPAHVFLHEFDIGRGDEDFRPPVELEFQMLLDLIVFLEQLEPAVAADAVRQMNDEIPFAEIEKAIDHAAQAALAGAIEIAAMKKFMAADQDQPPRHQAKAGGEPAGDEAQASLGGQPRRAEDFPQPLDLGLRLADDGHFISVGGRIEFLAHFRRCRRKIARRFRSAIGRSLRACRRKSPPPSPTGNDTHR